MNILVQTWRVSWGIYKELLTKFSPGREVGPWGLVRRWELPLFLSTLLICLNVYHKQVLLLQFLKYSIHFLMNLNANQCSDTVMTLTQMYRKPSEAVTVSI